MFVEERDKKQDVSHQRQRPRDINATRSAASVQRLVLLELRRGKTRRLWRESEACAFVELDGRKKNPHRRRDLTCLLCIRDTYQER